MSCVLDSGKKCLIPSAIIDGEKCVVFDSNNQVERVINLIYRSKDGTVFTSNLTSRYPIEVVGWVTFITASPDGTTITGETPDGGSMIGGLTPSSEPIDIDGGTPPELEDKDSLGSGMDGSGISVGMGGISGMSCDISSNSQNTYAPTLGALWLLTLIGIFIPVIVRKRARYIRHPHKTNKESI